MSKKIRNTSIRIISLISCVMVLISALILPAAATDTGDQTSAYQPQFIDLLEYGTDFLLTATKTDGSVLTQSGHEPLGQINSPVFSSVSFSWGDRVNKISYDYVYVAVDIPMRPDSVSFVDMAGTLCGVSDNLYFYRFNKGGNFWALFDILIDLPADFTGSFSISSVYGVVDQSTSIDEVNLNVRGQFVSDGSFYMDDVLDSSVILPYSFKWTYDNNRPSSGSPNFMYFDVNFPMPVPYADSVSLTFLSSNVWPNYYDQETMSQGGVQLFTGGTTKEVLPYIVSDCIAYTSVSGQPTYIYTVAVDLTGIELNNSSFLHFKFYMGPMDSYFDSSNLQIFYQLELISCTYKTVSYSKPWYVRFFYWIQDEFTSLKETIQSALGVGQAAPVRPDQDQQIQEQIQDNQQANDDIDNVIGELETAPTLPEFDDTGLDQFDTEVQDQTSPVQPVFVVIFENPLIFQMITYVFMFALGGFLLYGER